MNFEIITTQIKWVTTDEGVRFPKYDVKSLEYEKCGLKWADHIGEDRVLRMALNNHYCVKDPEWHLQGSFAAEEARVISFRIT